MPAGGSIRRVSATMKKRALQRMLREASRFVLLLLGLSSLASFATTVRMHTSLGDIDVVLMDEAAPATVANFLNYVSSGAYTDSFIHRRQRLEPARHRRDGHP